MMMITNTTPKFFRMIRKNLFILFLFLFLSCNKKEPLSLQSLKTPTGWGYTICYNNKIIIKQTIIPVISKNESFKTEEEALKVGDLVLKKLEGNLPPTITKNDLILLNINI
jgi:hypothetical protein